MENKKQINHLNLENEKFDPYTLMIMKMERMSWEKENKEDFYADRKELIAWFENLKDYSDEIVKLIVVKGILDNEFHKITFILTLARRPEFKQIASLDFYRMIYDFISKAPKLIIDWAGSSNFIMSRDVIALLAKIKV